MYRRVMINMRVLLLLFIATVPVSCSVQSRIAQRAKKNVLENSVIKSAQIGISIYDPIKAKVLYDHDADHYFVPASNTKIATCYAAMKHLGDSLTGLLYAESKNTAQPILLIRPTADPTLLHPDFANQPVFDFLNKPSNEGKLLRLAPVKTEFTRWGNGWSWNDYEEYYMAERSALPVLGNVITVSLATSAKQGDETTRSLFKTNSHYFDTLLNRQVSSSIPLGDSAKYIAISREINSNQFTFKRSPSVFSPTEIPFVTGGVLTGFHILLDSLHRTTGQDSPGNFYAMKIDDAHYSVNIGDHSLDFETRPWRKIRSQPLDSVLMRMMHRSDNFYAEQLLLMISDQLLGEMNDDRIIDTLVKTDFSTLPRQPRWADGSGLSRYNLFTPSDLVAILNNMRNEFGLERMKNIFATGGEGTILNYYVQDSGFIYGKTGTLSGVVGFSGFMITKKGKLLLFSTIVNNHTGPASNVRRTIEKFLTDLRRQL